MAKYKMVSLSVQIKGKVYYKRTNPIFDDSKLPKSELEAAAKAGFIELIEEEEKPKKAKAKAKEE